ALSPSSPIARTIGFVLRSTFIPGKRPVAPAWVMHRFPSGGRSGHGALWRSIGRALVTLVVCAGILVATSARADDALPGRVARVANVQGFLLHAPDERAGDWSEIGLNYPVAQGDNLYV